MNTMQMEDLLRDALHARAAEVTVVASSTPAIPTPSRDHRARPWLIPLVAAAAAVALLGAVLVGRTALSGSEGGGPDPAPAGPAPTALVPPAAAPAAFLGLRNAALVRYATRTGASTIVVAANPGTTVSSAVIAADGTIYYTIVVINDSTSGQLWKIPPGAQPQLLLDPPDWAPRAVTELGGTLAVAAGSRSGAPGSHLDDTVVILNASTGVEARRLNGSAAPGDNLQAMNYLNDGRLAVQVLGADRVSRTYVIDPASAASFDDGQVIPVDPEWQVSAVSSGPSGVIVAFWSGSSVEVHEVDPTTFISTTTPYASKDGEIVTGLSVDPASGAILAGRDRRASGGSPDAESVPLVVLDGDSIAVPGLEPPDVPPIDVVRIVGWSR